VPAEQNEEALVRHGLRSGIPMCSDLSFPTVEGCFSETSMCSSFISSSASSTPGAVPLQTLIRKTVNRGQQEGFFSLSNDVLAHLPI
jgi:hypothetical protein